MLSTGLQPAGADVEIRPNLPVNIVLIGDSYTAGNGAGAYYGPDGSFRSHNNYGEKYAEWLREQGVPARVTNLAWGGATTEDVLDEQLVTGNDSVLRQADLVLLTVGGNDVDFSGVVEACFCTLPAFLCDQSPTNCRTRVELAEAGLDDPNNDQDVRDQTWSILEYLDTKMDHLRGRVVLLGYPRLSLDTDYVIRVLDSIGGGDSPYNPSAGVRRAGQKAEDMQRDLVYDFNYTHGLSVTYLPAVDDRFVGHEPEPEIGRNPYRWLNEFFESRGDVGDDGKTHAKLSKTKAEFYHPNLIGHREMAAELADRIGAVKRVWDPDSTLYFRPAVDVVFVVDTTGSMDPIISQVSRNIEQIATSIHSRSSSVRFGLVEYRDDVDAFQARLDLDFTGSVPELKDAVYRLRATGGGDALESMYSGIMTALELDWRPGVRKMAFVFADQQAKDPEPVTGYTSDQVRDKSLAVDPVEIYGIGSAVLTGEPFAGLVSATNGALFEVGSDDLADAVADAIGQATANPEGWIQGPYVAAVGEPLVLNAGGSFSPAGEIVSYEWDFDGDGMWDQTTTGWTVEHVYGESFDGVAGVRVTGPDGLTALGSTPVLITNDGDSTSSEIDNCPDVENWGQADTDQDGVGDECDSTSGWMTLDGTLVGLTDEDIEAYLQASVPTDAGEKPSSAPSPTSWAPPGGTGSSAAAPVAAVPKDGGPLAVTGGGAAGWLRVVSLAVMAAGVVMIAAARRGVTRGRHERARS
ncbi:MAG: GDSL-type esterase/lipase family protein [Bifidobacteriaceae bacterium]|nr:GDSL-type esterase/lipase family protein [Bifidobacteriaceae bacterium]